MLDPHSKAAVLIGRDVIRRSTEIRYSSTATDIVPLGQCLLTLVRCSEAASQLPTGPRHPRATRPVACEQAQRVGAERLRRRDRRPVQAGQDVDHASFQNASTGSPSLTQNECPKHRSNCGRQLRLTRQFAPLL